MNAVRFELQSEIPACGRQVQSEMNTVLSALGSQLSAVILEVETHRLEKHMQTLA